MQAHRSSKHKAIAFAVLIFSAASAAAEGDDLPAWAQPRAAFSVAGNQAKPSLTVIMWLWNMERPFVSESFAKRLALLVLDEKYPKADFSVRGSGTTMDQGDTWVVTFDNALVEPGDTRAMPLVNGRFIAKRLSVRIRKANAEIIDVS
jgi:hypothetical protein